MITTLDISENLMVVGFENGQLTYLDIWKGIYEIIKFKVIL